MIADDFAAIRAAKERVDSPGAPERALPINEDLPSIYMGVRIFAAYNQTQGYSWCRLATFTQGTDGFEVDQKMLLVRAIGDCPHYVVAEALRLWADPPAGHTFRRGENGLIPVIRVDREGPMKPSQMRMTGT